MICSTDLLRTVVISTDTLQGPGAVNFWWILKTQISHNGCRRNRLIISWSNSYRGQIISWSYRGLIISWSKSYRGLIISWSNSYRFGYRGLKISSDNRTRQ